MMPARIPRLIGFACAAILLAHGGAWGQRVGNKAATPGNASGSAGSKQAASDPAGSDPAQHDRTPADKAALAPLQVFVGGWRGVGQLRRGSSQGAWTENSDWSWKFADGRAAIVFEAPKGKYFRSGRLAPGAKSGTFELTLSRATAATDKQTGGEATHDDRPAEDLAERFVGSLDKNHQLVAVGDDSHQERQTDAVARVSIRTVADGDRLIVLYEKRLPGQDRFARLAEVGYTRKGAAFAQGSGQPECVVTGGLGTIEVEHAGKKYHVCCTGCRDLFQDDPEGVLAEYRARARKGRKSRADD
jgi:hypothetical protein